MGSLIHYIPRTVVEAVLVFLAISYLPGVPPHMSFTSFSVAPSVALEGPYSLNGKLDGAELLLKGELKGPECIVFHKGGLYTGLHGGEVVRITISEANKKAVIKPVAKFGKPCGGFWEERKCGRPLGMKFGPDGLLYVADAYYGVHKVDVETGQSTMLVSPSEKIDGRVPRIPNSVDVASDGTVYWSDSSSDAGLEDGVLVVLGDASGRLLRYDPRSNSSTVLIDNIHFANGVALSPDEEFVIVAETMGSRVFRYFLKGPQAGQSEVMLEGLPGLPDNIKTRPDGAGFWVVLISARSAEHPILFQTLGPWPSVRRFVARLLGLTQLVCQQVHALFPNYYAQRAAHWLGHFESVQGLVLPHVTVLELDPEGRVTGSLHSTDGRLAGVSEVEKVGNWYYLGSPYSEYLARVPVSE